MEVPACARMTIYIGEGEIPAFAGIGSVDFQFNEPIGGMMMLSKPKLSFKD
jgi:hypothetical protein